MMKFIITVDTESDNEWARPKITTVENVNYLPRFQELCDSFDFKPTYLVSYEVADSRVFHDFAEPLVQYRKAEIGAHLHPWTCPPFNNTTPDDKLYHPYPHELPIQLFKDKMEILTDALELAFKTRPKTYRGGQWGFSPDHIKVLLDLGYVTDCSVTPYMSWERHLGDPKGKGGPDYRRAPFYPYFLDSNDVCKPGDSNLLEVPPTVLYTKMRWAKNIYLAMDKTTPGISALARLRLGPKMLRTALTKNAQELINIYQTARHLGLPYVQMMIHSSELMPGCSPYNPDEDSIEYLYSRLKVFFYCLKRDRIQGETLLDFATSYISSHRKQVL
jgi:hypothetical protein